MNAKTTLVASALVAALGGLLFGFDTAVISGCQEQIRAQLIEAEFTNRVVFNLRTGPVALHDLLQGLMTSSALVGTMIGAIAAARPADRWGRRATLKITAALFLVSAVGCAFAEGEGAWGYGLLVAFRLIGGLGVGAASVVGPMYLAEISPPNLRGRIVGFFQFNIVFGILVAFVSNYLVALADFEDIAWRVKLGLEAFPAMLFLLLLFFIPRSPRWLVRVGRLDEARDVLTRMGGGDVEKLLGSIRESVDDAAQPTAPGESPSDRLFQWRHRFPVFLAISIAVFNQLAGINALLYYLDPIFRSAGYDRVSSAGQGVAVGATNLIFTLLAMSVIDFFGRKALLLIGSVGTGASLLGVAYIFATGEATGLLLWLLLAYIAFFAFSQGAVIWVYISEVFPTGVRAKGQSLGSLTHWVMAGVVSLTFPLIAKDAGVAGEALPFAIFAGTTVVQFFVVWLVYPETRGAALEDVGRRIEADA